MVYWNLFEDDALSGPGYPYTSERTYVDTLKDKGVRFELEPYREYQNPFISYDTDVGSSRDRLVEIARGINRSVLGTHIAEFGYRELIGYRKMEAQRDPNSFDVKNVQSFMSALVGKDISAKL